MEIETLTAEAAVLSFTAEELPQSSRICRLCTLVRQAQLSRGLPVWDSMEASLLQCGTRALLLAWPMETVVYTFTELEALLTAVCGCPELPHTALTYMDGVWYLFLRCVRGRAPSILGEFGELTEGSKALLLHLCEHGEIILAENAVETLRQHFR